MDADILRKQIRKTLGSSKKFVALSEEDGDEQEEEEEDLNVVDSSDDDDDDDEGVNTTGDHDIAAVFTGSGVKRVSPTSSSASSRDQIKSRMEGNVLLSPDDELDVGHFMLSNHEKDDDENSENDKHVSHASVLDAWTKQIETSMSSIKQPNHKRCSSGDVFEDEESEGQSSAPAFGVQYAHVPVAAPSSATSPLTEETGTDDFVPAAQTREALENLGKTFLRVKHEAGIWLKNVLHKDDLFGNLDSMATDSFFEILKSGVLLCQVANKIIPDCIASFTEDFSTDTSFMVPLSERENIKKFTRACREAIHIPDSLLFEVGDLHNMQNMPKVLLSLRAVAEYARIHMGTEPVLHWQKTTTKIEMLEDEDIVLMASAEMSKMDSQTVHHMYAVEDTSKKLATRKLPSDVDEANFHEKKQVIQRNLALSTLSGRKPPISPPRSPVAPASGKSPPSSIAYSRGSSVGSDFDMSAVFSPTSPRQCRSHSPLAVSNAGVNSRPQTVEEWLDSIDMKSYYPKFAEEGWDDFETVLSMTEADLEEVGVKKKGHRRKISNALTALKTSTHDAAGMPVQSAGASSPERHIRQLSSSPRGAMAIGPALGVIGPRGLHVMDRKELYNKEMAWAHCRAKANVTMDLDDARSIWDELQQLKEFVSKDQHLQNFAPDVLRSIDDLIGLTDDTTRSLMPFEAPIAIDIGWDSIKIGYVFSVAPVLVPCVVGKYKPTETAQQRSTLSNAFSSGRHVFDQCHGVNNGSAPTVAALGLEYGNFVIRRAMHRGLDSITNPQVIEWDDLARLLDHAFRDILQANTERHPVLVIEPCQRWGTSERRKLADLLTEKHNTPALYFTPAAPLISFRSNLKSCVVVDLGESRVTASVVYNNRLVKDAVVHSPIGGLQLTELMMQTLNHEGYDFKTIFESRNPAKFVGIRHFMEVEIAREIKDRVCKVGNSYEEISVNAETLPRYLGDYLPRVCHGNTYINIGEPRVQVPEALFAPDIVRRDQFYRGGSLPHIIIEALSRCSETVAIASCATVVLSGGMANLPGLVGRLQKELNEAYAMEAKKPPRVILASEDDSDADPIFAAWQGGARVAVEHEFQSRWLAKELYQRKPDKILKDFEISEANGPFPLFSPDNALYKANRGVRGMKDLVSLLRQYAANEREQPQEGSMGINPRLQVFGQHQNTPKNASAKTILSTASSNDEGIEEPMSPRSLKNVIHEVAIVLQEKGCPENTILDVKMHLYSRYASQPPRFRPQPENVLLSLPEDHQRKLALYVDFEELREKSSKKKVPVVKKAIQSPPVGKRATEDKNNFFDDDEDDEDEDDHEDGIYAMAI